MKRILINTDNGMLSLAECVVLQAVKDYSRSYRKVLRDPDDEQADAMMQECEDFLITSVLVKELIDDPEALLFRLDQQIEAEHTRRKRCSR